jgi:hypothetical protein
MAKIQLNMQRIFHPTRTSGVQTDPDLSGRCDFKPLRKSPRRKLMPLTGNPRRPRGLHLPICRSRSWDAGSSRR